MSYSACGEPYHVAGYVDPIDALVARTPERFGTMDIEVHTRHEVREIDMDRRQVVIHDQDQERHFEQGFDQLMIATGAKPIRPEIHGRELDGVHELRTLDDAVELRRIADRGAGNAVIVGGGYIGLETAEAFHAQGWNVTVVTSGSSVLDKTIDSELGQKVVGRMEAIGIRVVLSSRVECINGTGQVDSVGCTDATFPADVVILGLGSEPEVGVAEAAGIGLERPVPSPSMIISGPATTACGLPAMRRSTAPGHGRPCNIHLGTIANKTGRIAGMNIGGEDATFPGVLGTAITRICDFEISATGSRRHDAVENGFDIVVGEASGTTTAGYMPEAAEITIATIAERHSGRILGAEIVGGPGTAKRIDVFATAIWSGMIAQDLAWTDLAYVPPFGGRGRSTSRRATLHASHWRDRPERLACTPRVHRSVPRERCRCHRRHPHPGLDPRIRSCSGHRGRRRTRW